VGLGFVSYNDHMRSDPEEHDDTNDASESPYDVFEGYVYATD
jgi:hypothetical protein